MQILEIFFKFENIFNVFSCLQYQEHGQEAVPHVIDDSSAIQPISMSDPSVIQPHGIYEDAQSHGVHDDTHDMQGHDIQPHGVDDSSAIQPVSSIETAARMVQSSTIQEETEPSESTPVPGIHYIKYSPLALNQMMMLVSCWLNFDCFCMKFSS